MLHVAGGYPGLYSAFALSWPPPSPPPIPQSLPVTFPALTVVTSVPTAVLDLASGPLAIPPRLVASALTLLTPRG